MPHEAAIPRVRACPSELTVGWAISYAFELIFVELSDSAHLSLLVRQRIQVPAHHTPLLQLGSAAALLKNHGKNSSHGPLLANISSLPILSIAAEILFLKSFLYRQTSSIGVCRFLRLQGFETRKHWIIADAGCKNVSHVIK